MGTRLVRLRKPSRKGYLRSSLLRRGVTRTPAEEKVRDVFKPNLVLAGNGGVMKSMRAQYIFRFNEPTDCGSQTRSFPAAADMDTNSSLSNARRGGRGRRTSAHLYLYLRKFGVP